MAELAAAPRRGDPPALSPYLRPLGWSMQQSRSTGEWYYVRTAPDGRRVRQRESPGYGWPAALLLAPERADQLYEEAEAEAVAEYAADTAGQTCYICYGEGEGLVRGCSCRSGKCFAHVSCLAEQAKILVAEAEENNLDHKAKDARWKRWYTCSLCKQEYHGVVLCALGWACWKTYVGRPETDEPRKWAMTQLGNGLGEAKFLEDALSVYEAELYMERRLGDSEENVLAVQTNLAVTYGELGDLVKALSMEQEVYSGRLKLNGEEHEDTLMAASNYATSLIRLQRFGEAKSLLRKIMPVARRVFGESHELKLKMRWNYASSLYKDPSATLGDLREAVETFEEIERTARRVLGGAHPNTRGIEAALREAREALRAREAPPGST